MSITRFVFLFYIAAGGCKLDIWCELHISRDSTMPEEDRGDASQVSWVGAEDVSRLVDWLPSMHQG